MVKNDEICKNDPIHHKNVSPFFTIFHHCHPPLPRDLLGAVTALSQAYTDDIKELEQCRKKLKRAECIIRDLREYLAEQMEASNYC